MQVPQKDKKVNVNISQSEKQRLQIGVSWDIEEKNIETGVIFKKNKKIVETFDLDISCYIFDKEKEFIEMVRPDNTYLMDSSEHIYHSGDNTTGRISGDDEFISVNLAGLPENIHSIVFVVTSPRGYGFGKVMNPEARVSDGKTDDTQLLVPLGEGKEDATATAFIFVGLYRDTKQESGWALHNISKSLMKDAVKNWADELQEFIPHHSE